MRDEGRPLGLGRQGQGPNHEKLLRHNGRGGERSRKRRDETRQVSAGKTSVSEPSSTCRKLRDAIETRLQSLAWEGSGGWPAYCPDGGRHKDGVSPAQALVRNAGTCTPMPRETSKRLTREEPSTDAGCSGRTGRVASCRRLVFDPLRERIDGHHRGTAE